MSSINLAKLKAREMQEKKIIEEQKAKEDLNMVLNNALCCIKQRGLDRVKGFIDAKDKYLELSNQKNNSNNINQKESFEDEEILGGN